MGRRDIFVTGTDTGVGKTLVCSGLLSAWSGQGRNVVGMKPVASGCRRGPEGLVSEDALMLRTASSRPWPYALVNPVALEPAIAPHLAAAEAGIEVGLAAIAAAFATLQAGSERVVVEGAGGFLVPLGPRLSFADLPAALGLEVVLVVGLRLGCLNHALLTSEAISRRGLRLAGWIGNRIDPGFERVEANLATLAARLDAPCVGIIEHLATPDPALAARGLANLAALDLP